ncbi:flagellar hook protein FlgE [Dactylosporangium aurantiacum]|uniref:Flagellar hook protein FlgE n=1 Tax=Dactylosporangium aurantiacum TaxID=35754 RepID=A0A9Q9IC14_9ACTN|nr:flagellar hook protein FlgE [Dactylosporangium aurantiacum]MDG6102022.1 flagellar hook protein FlgE [Dactylosporangium aurantiacum]UWZ53639.1 flagellar hook protein FlgE [Dactylosporangium aurantiacum]
MLRSLFSGISGLRAHQQMMDVTSNNIANVNTVGFKSSQVVFQDTLSQMMRAAGAPQQGQGGTNPAQVGLGVRLGAINTSFVQGSAQTTGRATDVMISGDGFFVVNSVNEQLYTRAGAFNFDAEGKLVTPTGAAVQGWPAVNGEVNTNAPIGDIRLPMGTLIAPNATRNMVIAGNLPADAPVNTTIPRSIKTYDVQGNVVTLTTTFTLTAGGWEVVVSDGTSPSAATPLTFLPNGQISLPTYTDANGDTKIGLLYDPDGDGVGVEVDLAGLTEYTGNTTVSPLSQNGSPAATLQSFSINPDGQLVGVFSNGNKQTVAQLALANFNNPPGLEKVGDSLYRFTVNSGLAQVGVAGTVGLGTLQSGAVEMSNVDLAQEFTNLIVAQRGFQANSKVISTSDDVLQELVNLKR